MEDMEKRAMIAVALSIVVLVLWTRFFAPEPPPPVPEEAPAAVVPVEEVLEPAEEPAEEPAPAPLEPVASELEEEVTVQTDLYEIVLTNRGGRVLSWKLLDYVDDDGEPVQLVSPGARATGRLPLAVWVPGRDELTSRIREALFRVEREPVQGGETLRMVYVDPAGLQVEKVLTFHRGSYLATAEVAIQEGGRQLPAWLVWGPGFGETAEGAKVEATRFLSSGGVVLNHAGSVTRVTHDKVEEVRQISGEGPVLWAGMETTYFAALIIPASPAPAAAVIPAEVRTPPAAEGEDEHVQRYVGVAVEPPSGEAGAYTLYVGPKDYFLLREIGHDLASVINFGWPVIREIAQGLFVALVWVQGYVKNYGVAILLLTFVIRLVFFPIMYGTQVKMRKMQQKTKRIQPKMKAIRERYRKAKMDFQARQKMNEEIMALYRKEGINPMGGLGGCLPILLQLPFLYGFYQLLNVTIELRHAPFFGWIQDLSRPDPFYVTPLLMGVSMLVQTKISMASVADPNQRRMMTMMSVVFTVFFLNLPSGLVLYWFFSNLLGIAQQVLVNRRADDDLEQQRRKKPGNPQAPRRARAASRG